MTTPRPHPRFAGADVLILHGADMVQEGASEGKPGKIAGGVVVIVIGIIIAALVYYFRDVLARWLGRARAAAGAADEDGVAPPPPGSLEMVRLPTAAHESGDPSVASSPLARRVDFQVNVDVEPAREPVNWLGSTRTYL